MIESLLGQLVGVDAELIEFQWPWAFYALVLPFVVRWLFPAAASAQEAALRVPNLKTFASQQLLSKSSQRQSGWLWWLALLAWLCLVTAAARPMWYGEPIELPVSGRDLMLAVDLSGSMEMEDFVINGKRVNRLQATQKVAGEFIERRVGDRLGLILFGEEAYVQTPLTFDRETVKTFLNEAVIGLAGQSTAIGDAIGLAVKRLRDISEGSRVLILLTDGANTAGEVAPIKAAEIAAQFGLKIYTIGVGADEMMVRSLFGQRRINPSQDLDEKTLTAIAEATGGRYFRARDTADLSKIYALLDELEPIEQEKASFRPQQALYFWPLLVASLMAVFIFLIKTLRR